MPNSPTPLAPSATDRLPAVTPDRPADIRQPRDLRLDFFRGLGMFIILYSHMPGNPWALWIPARFGFSDATEIFVFCSGMASGIAFGRVFDLYGWATGAARVMFRVWQVYWSHIGVFIVIAAMTVILNDLAITDRDYVARLNLYPFFDLAKSNLVGLVTLTYVPNYFDILPMYLGILSVMPVVMLLARAGRWVVAAFIACLWLGATFNLLALPAEPWSDRVWFFNPFAWQLVFFTGFAFIRGWIPTPPIDRRLVAAAIVVILASVPFAYFRILNAVPELQSMHQAISPLVDKTDFGIFRYVHFLALAYLAWAAAGEGGRRLARAGLWGATVTVVRRVGQQSLAVFMMSLVAAQFCAFVLDVTGRDLLTVALANLGGSAVLVATAYTTGWFKAQPWRRRPPPQGTVV